MEHLQATCPKLARQYPLNNVVHNHSVNKVNEERVCSKGKGESSEYIDAPGEDYFDLIRHDQGIVVVAMNHQKGRALVSLLKGLIGAGR